MKRSVRLLAPALACLLPGWLWIAFPPVGGRARAGDDADIGSDQGSDVAAGQHADAGARAHPERGELTVAVRLACLLQGSARGAGRRHRHHSDRHERHCQREERHHDQHEAAPRPGVWRASSACKRVLPKTITDPSKILNVGSTNNNGGSGQIQRNEAVTMRLAGVVTQVLPNGNLVVSARQEFRVNSELRELQVTGVIRPQDIASDNTVLHDRMAEARIAYGGRGELTEVQTHPLGPAVDGYSAAVLRLRRPCLAATWSTKNVSPHPRARGWPRRSSRTGHRPCGRSTPRPRPPP